MKENKGLNRRDFVTSIVPACAVTCITGCGAVAATQVVTEPEPTAEPPTQLMKCDFDAEYPKKLTYREFFMNRYQSLVSTCKFLVEELGREETIGLIKKLTERDLLKLGAKQAEKAEKNDLNSYVEMFRGEEGFKNTILKEIVEDTENAFELKVTKCIWAETFINLEAADIGFAHVCHGDYAWAEGFNPKIKLIRDKTLMQGHDHCNHRYVWTG